jgi:hypothetical protein
MVAQMLQEHEADGLIPKTSKLISPLWSPQRIYYYKTILICLYVGREELGSHRLIS